MFTCLEMYGGIQQNHKQNYLRSQTENTCSDHLKSNEETYILLVKLHEIAVNCYWFLFLMFFVHIDMKDWVFFSEYQLS